MMKNDRSWQTIEEIDESIRTKENQILEMKEQMIGQDQMKMKKMNQQKKRNGRNKNMKIKRDIDKLEHEIDKLNKQKEQHMIQGCSNWFPLLWQIKLRTLRMFAMDSIENYLPKQWTSIRTPLQPNRWVQSYELDCFYRYGQIKVRIHDII